VQTNQLPLLLGFSSQQKKAKNVIAYNTFVNGVLLGEKGKFIASFPVFDIANPSRGLSQSLAKHFYFISCILEFYVYYVHYTMKPLVRYSQT
jgi:hypothetical protein